MKLTMKLLVLCFGVLMLGNVANAESPRGQFRQMVEQLQGNPYDDALREKIINLALKLKPAPAVPDAAVEFEGRAQFAFKNARSNDDYLAAAREYEKAVADAPWVTGYYVDLCTIYEKAGKFAEAKRNCEFSLIGVVDSAQITDIKRRIAGLKYGIEQNSPESIVAKKRAESAKRGVVGFWQIYSRREVYANNPYYPPRNVSGMWEVVSGPLATRSTYEITKTSDSYEIAVLTNPYVRYKAGKADATTIELIQDDCDRYSEICGDYRCEIEGEGLLCKETISKGGTIFNRNEERWIRRESCVTGSKTEAGEVPVRCQ